MTGKRVFIDLAADDIAALDREASRRGISRAAAIREAVTEYIRLRDTSSDAALGSWKRADPKALDGLAFQRIVRGEWR